MTEKAEKAMANGDELMRGLAEATAFGALGRAVYYALGGQRPSRATMWLWELPAAIGLGVMAEGLAVYLELPMWPRVALICFCAAAGVKAMDAFIDRIFGPGGKKP